MAIPLNAWHQEFNASATEPCRVFFCTDMCYVINWYCNLDYVFDNAFIFKDRYSHAMQSYFAEEGKHWAHRVFETNFIPDVRSFSTLDDNPVRGHRHTVQRIGMTGTSIGMHIAEVSEGTYMTAHRHGAGAHVVVVVGQGYELLYMPGEEKNRRKVPLKPYSVVCPKHNEFHQHLNTGKGPFRMLAFRGATVRYGWGREYSRVSHTAQSRDQTALSFNVTYEMEDPSIREEYYRELEKNGVSSRLPPLNQSGM